MNLFFLLSFSLNNKNVLFNFYVIQILKIELSFFKKIFIMMRIDKNKFMVINIFKNTTYNGKIKIKMQNNKY